MTVLIISEKCTQSTVRKMMAALHFTTIPCEPNEAHWAYGNTWFKGSRSYTKSIALVKFEKLTIFLCVFIRSFFSFRAQSIKGKCTSRHLFSYGGLS